MEELQTQVVSVFVDQITQMGSAFGATNQGEAVFINGRIVTALNIQHGDKLKAYVLPNYEDKRANVPWRALRAEVQGSVFEDISSEVQDAREEDLEPLPMDVQDPVQEPVPMSEQILDLLSETGPLRAAYIARELGFDTQEVITLCRGLFAEGRLVRADIFTDPSNKRAIRCVWALDMNDYDDGFEQTAS